MPKSLLEKALTVVVIVLGSAMFGPVSNAAKDLGALLERVDSHAEAIGMLANTQADITVLLAEIKTRTETNNVEILRLRDNVH